MPPAGRCPAAGGAGGTGLGAHGALACPPRPPGQSGCRRRSLGAPSAWPHPGGGDVVGGAGGQAGGAPQGEGWGATPNALRPPEVPSSSGCSVGRALRRPGVTRGPGCSAVGGLRHTDHGLHTDGDGGQRVRDHHRSGRTAERAGPKRSMHTRLGGLAQNMGGGHRPPQVPQDPLDDAPGVIAAMIRSVPCGHTGQRAMSMANTRLRHRAQLQCGEGAVASAPPRLAGVASAHGLRAAC